MVDLLPEEKIVEKTYISRVAKLYYYIVAALLIVLGVYLGISKITLFGLLYASLVTILIGIGLIVVSELRRLYHRYLITDKRVIKETGILKSEVTAWELRQIINIKIHQSLAGRLTGFGTVDIVLTNNNNLFLESVRHPEKMMGLIEELVEKKR